MMNRELVFTLSRSEINEIVLKRLREIYPDIETLPRMWTDIKDAKGETLIDDLKCPEVFSYHFADPL